MIMTVEKNIIKDIPSVKFCSVTEHHVGQRVDNFLMRELKGVPKTRIYRALRKGEVRVNKGRVKADYRVQEGDLIRIPPIRVQQDAAEVPINKKLGENLQHRILYEDTGLIVINKPSGLAVHGGSGLNYGLIEAMRQMRPQAKYLELVHRLDRDTSGCTMIAKKANVLKQIHIKLRGDGVDKRYIAMVEGKWPKHCTRVEAPLAKNTLQSGERMVRVQAGGKASVTEFRIIKKFNSCTLVEAKPITGRTHQIRVHAKHAGHPILGDEKYGTKEANKEARRRGLKRLFLHAKSLSLNYPEDLLFNIESPLDTGLSNLLDILGK